MPKKKEKVLGCTGIYNLSRIELAGSEMVTLRFKFAPVHFF